MQAVRADAAGVAQAVDLGVRDGVAVLHALVVAGGDDLAVDDQRRADGDASLGEALFHFVDGSLHPVVDLHGRTR